MSHKIHPLIIFWLLLILSCNQQTSKEIRELDLENLNKTRALLANAMLQGDVEILNKIYHEDYWLITRKGAFRSRKERLKMIESDRLKYIDLGTESDVIIKTYGNIAVVRGIISSAETEFEGERRKTGHRRFTAIWVHENKEWRQIGRQHTVIENVLL
jgi:hypothetical protein